MGYRRSPSWGWTRTSVASTRFGRSRKRCSGATRRLLRCRRRDGEGAKTSSVPPGAIDDRPVAYIDAASVAVGAFRLPPNEISETLPQQLLMLQSVARALRDAGVCRQDADLRTGVIIGMGLDLNTTNFHHRWALLGQARQWARSLGLQLDDQRLDEWGRLASAGVRPGADTGTRTRRTGQHHRQPHRPRIRVRLRELRDLG